MRRRNRTVQTWLLLVICIVVSTLALAAPASGQGAGFLVNPMRINFAARPGRTAEKVLKLRNTDPDKAGTLNLRLLELTQAANGNWQIIEPDSDFDTSKLSSCLNWITLSADSVRVEPLQVVTVPVKVKVPHGARGFYVAGLIAQTARPRDAKGVVLLIRFLIPLVVEVQGRPVRQKIQLNDVGMEFIEQSEKHPATTMVSMSIANQGKTYSRIKGSASVMRYREGHWRLVTRAALKELGIIPGARLNLKSDLKRRLPSGKYRLTGTLYVDGRRIRLLEKEIEFVGDPTVTKVAVDTPLTLEPPMLSISAVPGANRSAVIKVENASEDAVGIEAALVVPSVLRGVALGDLKGEDLVCTEWVQVVPERFTVRGGGWRNLAVVAKMPNAEKMHANYYTVLGLRATYPDGQKAGQTTTIICVENKMVEAKPAAQVMKLTLAADEPSKYIVHAKFGNIGNVHFTPKCTAAITTAIIGATVAQTALSGETSLMLPLETRDFSGVLDFSRVDAGTYSVKAALEYAGGKAVNREIPVRVSVEDGQRLVEIIEQKEKGPEPPKKTSKTSE